MVGGTYLLFRIGKRSTNRALEKAPIGSRGRILGLYDCTGFSIGQWGTNGFSMTSVHTI